MPILKFLPATEIETKFFRPKTKDVIEYLLKKMLFSQPELGIDDKPQSVQITKEFLESWIAQGLNLRKIASGNYPIDVYSETGYYGIDVKFMSVSNPLSKSKELMTNESSLLQNFKEGGIDLDMNFSQKQSDVILNKWKILLTQKMKRVTDIHSLKNIYYFLFVRCGHNINLAVASFDPSQIIDLSINQDKVTNTSIGVSGFLESKYGNVKIYKSKKRMELRVNYTKLNSDKKFITWDFNKIYTPKQVNLLEQVENLSQFKKYITTEFNNLFIDN